MLDSSGILTDEALDEVDTNLLLSVRACLRHLSWSGTKESNVISDAM
jgi:hypothetical protein